MKAHTTESQSVNPPVVDYERAAISPERMQVRREGNALVVTIPPPDLWRLVVSHALGAVLLLLLICAVVIVSALSRGGSVMVVGYIAGVTLVVLLSSSLLRLIRVARYGRTPAELRASADELSATLPPRERGRPKRLAAALIADLWVRQGGLAPSRRDETPPRPRGLPGTGPCRGVGFSFAASGRIIAQCDDRRA